MALLVEELPGLGAVMVWGCILAKGVRKWEIIRLTERVFFLSYFNTIPMTKKETIQLKLLIGL